jgi:hypothetical protein
MLDRLNPKHGFSRPGSLWLCQSNPPVSWIGKTEDGASWFAEAIHTIKQYPQFMCHRGRLKGFHGSPAPLGCKESVPEAHQLPFESNEALKPILSSFASAAALPPLSNLAKGAPPPKKIVRF